MKKIKFLIKFIIIIIILFISFKLTMFLIINRKENTYKLKKIFTVRELYTKNNNYFINIKFKKYNFNYINDNDYYKNMNIINDIKYINNKEITCLYPVFKDTNDSEVICNKNGVYYNYYSVKDNSYVKEFIKTLKKSGYNVAAWNNSNKYSVYNNIKVYNNIPDLKLVIWNYTGIDIISSELKTIKLSNDDIYNNKLGVLVNNVYVCPDFSNNFSFNTIREINLENYKIKDYELEADISYDSYINGIKNNGVYYMDNDSLKQYSYSVEKHELKEVGNKEDGAIIYKDGREEFYNIYDLRKKEIYFSSNIKLDKLEDKYDITSVYKYLNRYYFITDDYEVYMVYEDDLNTPIFLFKSDSIIEPKLVGDYFFFMDEDNIYMYNRYNGLKKLITKNELLYNNKNIYDVYVN